MRLANDRPAVLPTVVVLSGLGLTWVVGCARSSDSDEVVATSDSAASGRAETQRHLPAAPLPAEQKPNVFPRAPRPGDWFEDVTDGSGIDFAYHDGSDAGFYTLLESVGGGAALFDYDGDGDLDIFFPGGGSMTGPPIVVHGRSGALFRNDGDMTFTEVTETVGLGADDLYTHGCTVGDYDADGDPDLLVTGFGGVRLYRNEQGERFVDVTERAGLVSDEWNTAAVFADYNRDGWPDLFLATYAQWEPGQPEICPIEDPKHGPLRDVCGPMGYRGQGDRLWRNRGDGTFEDVTASAGLSAKHRGLGLLATDFDGDGWVDFFVANDAQKNDLYFGGAHLPFEERGVVSGVAYSPDGNYEGSMGVDLGDFDGDGRADLWYTNFSRQENSLCRKVDPRGFLNVTDVTGLVGVSRQWVGFGTALTDFDGDTWPDLFIANGHVRYSGHGGPYYQPPQLFRNVGGTRFEEVSAQGGPYFSVPHAGRGVAVGDLDNDGGLDLVVVHQNDPVTLLRNRQPYQHWIRVALRGSTAVPQVLGAKVSVRFKERTLRRWVAEGRGYLSRFDPRLLFPAPDETPVTVKVTWPQGETEWFADLATGTTHVLTAGTGRTSR